MNRETLYGSARWATDAELKVAGLYKPCGLHFGLGLDRRSPLWLDGDAPLFTAAGSGSGKGTTIIIPAILTQRGPLFVLDPKGENAALTLHHQARLGKDAYCINPWGIHHDAPWFLPMHAVNPLDVLQANSSSLAADCKLIMEMMIPKGGGGEAAQLGHFEMLKTAYSYNRAGGVRTWAFFQSIGQLEGLYGHGDAQSIMECAQLRQFFGVGHYDTARLVSGLLGVETVFYDDPLYQSQHENEATNVLMSGGLTTQDMLRAAGHIEQSRMKSATRRLLMQPDEVLRLEPDQQVCFISGKKPSLSPVLAGRRPYYLRPDLAGAYLSNPYRPPFDRVKVASRFGWSWTWKVWSHEVLPHFAGLPQYQQGKMSYAARSPLLAASRASGGALGGSVGRGVGKLLSGY